jgi:hypothetical protein
MDAWVPILCAASSREGWEIDTFRMPQSLVIPTKAKRSEGTCGFFASFAVKGLSLCTPFHLW